MAKKSQGAGNPPAHIFWSGGDVNLPGFDGSHLGSNAHLEYGRVYKLSDLPENFSHTLALPCESDGTLIAAEAQAKAQDEEVNP